MAARRSIAAPAPRVIGAAPLGVTKKVADAMVREFYNQFNQNGRSMTLRSVRFIPSSRVDTEDGAFQLVANNILEIAPGELASPRVEAVDSVVTVVRAPGGAKLGNLKIPALQAAAI